MIRGSILLFSSTHRKVIGNVTALKVKGSHCFKSINFTYRSFNNFHYLDAVPKAVIHACIIPLKKTAGFLRVNSQKIVGNVIIPCINKPNITVIINNPNICAVAARFTIDIIFPAIKHIIPNGDNLNGSKKKKNERSIIQHIQTFKKGFYLAHQMIIIPTNFMTISLSTTKKSTISFPFGPNCPAIIPKVMQNMIRPMTFIPSLYTNIGSKI